MFAWTYEHFFLPLYSRIQRKRIKINSSPLLCADADTVTGDLSPAGPGADVTPM